MKYLMLFLCFAVIISTVLASGSDPDWYNGEIVMFDVYASSDTGKDYDGHNVAWIWANASVSAESGSKGWFSVWAEAGNDRRANDKSKDYNDSGSYLAGRNGLSESQYAASWVSRNNDNWDYVFRSAYINSQDDEDWAPK